jgi:hypothetical protein
MASSVNPHKCLRHLQIPALQTLLIWLDYALTGIYVIQQNKSTFPLQIILTPLSPSSNVDIPCFVFETADLQDGQRVIFISLSQNYISLTFVINNL